jgi:hypothetical protein
MRTTFLASSLKKTKERSHSVIDSIHTTLFHSVVNMKTTNKAHLKNFAKLKMQTRICRGYAQKGGARRAAYLTIVGHCAMLVFAARLWAAEKLQIFFFFFFYSLKIKDSLFLLSEFRQEDQDSRLSRLWSSAR